MTKYTLKISPLLFFFSNVSTENIQKDSSLRNVATETDTLKKQVATLKRSNDNAVTENG